MTVNATFQCDRCGHEQKYPLKVLTSQDVPSRWGVLKVEGGNSSGHEHLQEKDEYVFCPSCVVEVSAKKRIAEEVTA